jgi:integrase
MRVYPRKKRNGERVWWASWTQGKRTIRRSTKCSTKPAAELVAARWERERADPAYAAANSTTLGLEAAEFLKDCKRAVAKRKALGGVKQSGTMAAATLEMYEQKIGNVLAVLGPELPLIEVDASKVKEYVDQRLEEGAQESTVYKEWIALRGILKNAKHYGRFHREVASLKPPRFSGQSKPKETFLTWEQIALLLPELAPARRQAVRFALATGAREDEWQAAVPGDIKVTGAAVFVHLHGTKTRKSDRVIPVPSIFRHFIEGVKLPLEPWSNALRDIAAACRRASICEPHRTEEQHVFQQPAFRARPVAGCPDCAARHVPRVTWNDLRRTFSSLLAHAGVSSQVRAELMGHETTVMTDTKYTRVPATTLRAMLEIQLPPAPTPALLPAATPADVNGGDPTTQARALEMGTGPRGGLGITRRWGAILPRRLHRAVRRIKANRKPWSTVGSRVAHV